MSGFMSCKQAILHVYGKHASDASTHYLCTFTDSNHARACILACQTNRYIVTLKTVVSFKLLQEQSIFQSFMPRPHTGHHYIASYYSTIIDSINI